MIELKCRHGCEDPVAIYYLNRGCACFQDHLQALCEQHIYKADPIDRMDFICLVPGVQRREDIKIPPSQA